MIRIKDTNSAAEFLAQQGLLADLDIDDDGQVVEQRTCNRCCGRGFYSIGVCFECNNVKERRSWVVRTPIITYARKVKTANAAKERRRQASKRDHERSLERQRTWCEDNGHGRITFEEKRAKQQLKWEEAQKARAARSSHVGEIKKRDTFTLRIERIIDLGTSSFGWQEVHSDLVKMTTLDGHAVTWITSSGVPEEFVKGALLRVKATPKTHDEYKGEKQTKVTRCKLVEVIESGKDEEQVA